MRPIFGSVLVQRIIGSVLVLLAAGKLIMNWRQDVSHPSGSIRINELTIHITPDTIFGPMKVRIAIALGAAGVALLFRNRKVAMCSIAALAWIVAEYLIWTLRTYQIVRSSEAQDYAQIPHTLMLCTATWLDVLVLVLSSCCLIWQIGYLLRRAQFRIRT